MSIDASCYAPLDLTLMFRYQPNQQYQSILLPLHYPSSQPPARILTVICLLFLARSGRHGHNEK